MFEAGRIVYTELECGGMRLKNYGLSHLISEKDYGLSGGISETDILKDVF